MLDYKNLINFIDRVYIDNKILNGTCLTLDNSLTNIDQIYFKNITKKMKKIFITGCLGYIGIELINYFLV